MKHISNVLDLSTIRDRKQETKDNSKTAEVINWLFGELRSNFNAFREAWSNPSDYESAKKTWLKAFMLSGINSMEQLQHGLNKCYLMERPFVPSPGEFIAWCKPKPENLGLFRNEHAYLKAVEYLREGDSMSLSETQKTVFKHALDYTGRYDMRHKPEREIRPIFERNYDISVRDFIAGNLSPIPKGIEDQKTREVDPNFVHLNDSKKAMDEIKRMLGMGNNDQQMVSS